MDPPEALPCSEARASLCSNLQVPLPLWASAATPVMWFLHGLAPRGEDELQDRPPKGLKVRHFAGRMGATWVRPPLGLPHLAQATCQPPVAGLGSLTAPATLSSLELRPPFVGGQVPVAQACRRQLSLIGDGGQVPFSPGASAVSSVKWRSQSNSQGREQAAGMKPAVWPGASGKASWASQFFLNVSTK